MQIINGVHYFPRESDSKEGFAGEVWLPVVGLEGYVEVSSYGRVITLDRMTEFICRGKPKIKYFKGRILKLSKDKDGYLIASPRVNGIYYRDKVHRMVCKAFHPNPENKPQVNHIDSNRANNHYKNLEWATPKENCIHGSRYGFRISPIIPPMPGKLNPRARRLGQYSMDDKLLAEFDYVKEVEEKLGLSVYMIREAAKGRIPQYKGFKWKYL